MRRLTMFLLSVLAIRTSAMNTVRVRGSTHFEKLKEKYPYGLLTDDFEILSEEDLEINVRNATPAPFSSDSTSYQYWQCFETGETSFLCDHSGTQDPGQPTQAFIVLIVSGRIEGHEYLARRPMELKTCRFYEREWMRLTAKEKHVCFSGSLIRRGQGSGSNVTTWVFDKYKTRKGCSSYFDGGCKLNRQVTRGKSRDRPIE